MVLTTASGPSRDSKTVPGVRIVIAEDHALVRQGIKRIVEEDPALHIIDEAEDGLELIELVEKDAPDLIILDISMPRLSGLEAAAIIKKHFPKVKILILSMHRSGGFFRKAMEVGVDGYLLKEDVDMDLHAAIEAVLKGKTFISPLLYKMGH